MTETLASTTEMSLERIASDLIQTADLAGGISAPAGGSRPIERGCRQVCSSLGGVSDDNLAMILN